MKKKISFIIVLAVHTLCAFMLVWLSTDTYNGVQFNHNYGILVFCTLEFVALSLLMKNREDCLFFDNNIIRLTRISSRRKATCIEILKICTTVLIVEIFKIALTALFSILLGKLITFKGIMLLFALELFVKLILMLIQFALELISSYNFSFLIICISFLLLLLIGTAIYLFTTENPEAAITPILRIINKYNLINYISPYRAKLLCTATLQPLAAIMALNLLQIVILVFSSKKVSILPKE